MAIARCFDIIGLVAGFLGALLLLRYQSPVTLWVTENGLGIINWTNSPTPEQVEANKRRGVNTCGDTGLALLCLRRGSCSNFCR
jgi:hypothetical protein